MASKESTRRENQYWQEVAQRKGSPRMYQVERTTPLGVGVYKPTPPANPTKEDK